LPRALDFIDGVISLRGMVIPVVDMRKRFDLPDCGVTSLTRLLIVKVVGQLLGLVVDDVAEVVTVPVKDIKPPPQLTTGPDADCLIGVCLIKDEMVLLLNLDKILTTSEAHALGSLTRTQQ
jgi:purine-binding chemotaxis protein CheW